MTGKRHLEISEKYYLGDLGLRHALIGYRPENINDDESYGTSFDGIRRENIISWLLE